MDRGAVVALHEVLDDELPVGLHVVGDAPADLELVDLPALDDVVVTEPPGDRAGDGVLERRRLVGQAHPDVAQPLPQVDGDQPVLRAVDVLHLREVRRGHERAVEGVGPGVVPALELALAGSRLLHAHAGAAVPADVQERAQLPVAATDDQHVLPAHVDGAERAGTVEVGRPRSGEPVRLEDPRLLLLEDRRVGVGVAGQGGDEAGREFSADGHGTPFDAGRGGRGDRILFGIPPADAAAPPPTAETCSE